MNQSNSPYQVLPSDRITTNVRWHIVAVSMLMAFIMYLDRICMGEIVKSSSFLDDVKISRNQIGDILGAFFWSYALMQVPAGWISDRFGARTMLAVYIVAWSVLTGLTGIMTSTTGFFLARLGVGVFQAGAYPTSSGIIRRWIPLQQRGRASSMVSFGGRVGGTVAPYLTTFLVVHLGGWRPTLYVYTGFGLLVAVAYWMIVRDSVSDHPRCSPSERELIGAPVNENRPQLAEVLPMLAGCVRSRSLWMNSIVQFFINIGWVYLVTWLPTYLKEVKKVSDETGGMMVSLALGTGMLGQLIGGWTADLSVRHFGLKRGRAIPVSAACFVAGIAYLCCPSISNPWGIVACCAVVSLMTDIGNPSSWAFMQDIGGKTTSAIYGWGNMWGNFGAGATAMLVPRLLNLGDSLGMQNSQSLVFVVFGCAFFIAAIAALGMDATRPVQIQGRQ